MARPYIAGARRAPASCLRDGAAAAIMPAVMYCPACGTKNDDNAFRCVSCNEIVQLVTVPPPPAPAVAVAVAVAASPPRRLGDDPGIRLLLPVGRSGWAI